MSFSRPNRLILGLGLAAAIVAALVLVSFRSTSGMLDASRWVAHTHEVISIIEEIYGLVEEAETAQRGFVITGQPEYVEQVERSKPLLARNLANLERMLSREGAQQERLVVFRQAIDAKMRHVDQVVTLRRLQGFEAAQAVTVAGGGRLAMDRVRAEVSRLRDSERALLSLRRTRSERQAVRTMIALAAGSAIDLLLVALLAALIVRDARRSGELNSALRVARDEAIQTSELRSQFLANMSHEIRTPMNAVVGMSGLLLSTKLDADQRDLAFTVRSSAEALLTVINDILDFSKIEAGKLSIEHLDFEVRPAVGNVVALFKEAAQAKGLGIGVLFDHETPVFLNGDEGRIRQILTNLVGNAIKFTSHGEVIVHLNVEAGDEQTVRVRFAVTDTGIGLSDDAQDRLFQPFSQADASTTRRFGGTGLGLAISRHLAELMGGAIGLDTVAGRGSTFWFSLPLRRASLEEERARPEGEGNSDAALPLRDDVRILVVEDHPVNRKLAVRQLEKLGYRADTATNGVEAIEALGRASYDLVLMDCQMPEMDGYAATREIRSREAGARHVPVIALTANALQGDRDRCLAAGMDDYLAKPVSEKDLARALDRWLGHASAVEAPSGDGSSAEVDLDPETLAGLRELGGGSDDFLKEIAGLYLGDAPARIAAISKALSAWDAAALIDEAHALKSSSGNMGARRVREAAATLEAIGRSGSSEGADAAAARLEEAWATVERRLMAIAGRES